MDPLFACRSGTVTEVRRYFNLRSPMEELGTSWVYGLTQEAASSLLYDDVFDNHSRLSPFGFNDDESLHKKPSSHETSYSPFEQEASVSYHS